MVLYLQEIPFLVPIGSIEDVLLNFNSYSQGQLLLTIKLQLGGCSQEDAC